MMKGRVEPLTMPTMVHAMLTIVHVTKYIVEEYHR